MNEHIAGAVPVFHPHFMINSCGSIEYGDSGFARIKVEASLGRYLRKLFTMYTYGVYTLSPSMHGYHITIISKEDKIPQKIYRAFTLSFSILLNPATNGNAIYYPVRSIAIEDFRLRLGLKARPSNGLHYCVGYLHEGKLRDFQRTFAV